MGKETVDIDSYYVGDHIPEARFAIGDFVHCRYTYYQFYYPFYDDDDYYDDSHYGIVVEVDFAKFDEWPGENIYVVFCTDRIYRFFAEEELTKLS